MAKCISIERLEDWIGFKIDNRTKYDLTISSGLALLAAQKVKQKEARHFEDKVFFRRYTRRSADLLYLHLKNVIHDWQHQ